MGERILGPIDRSRQFSGLLKGQPGNNEEVETRVRESLTTYMDKVRALNLVGKILVGAVPKTPEIYVYSVIDKYARRTPDSNRALSEAEGVLFTSLRDKVTFRFSEITPDQVDQLRANFKSRRMHSLTVSFASSTK